MPTFDPIWNTVHESRAWGKYPPEEVVRFVARTFRDKESQSIRLLDLGCGGGAVAWFLAREGYQTTAFDGSAAAVAKARKRLEQEQLHAEFSVADAGSLPYEDESFHGVFDSAAITSNTYEGIQTILREAHRVLTPGGVLFSTGLFTENTTGFGSGTQVGPKTYRNMTEGLLANLGTVSFFARKDIDLLWCSAGFKIKAIDTIRRTDFDESVCTEFFLVQAEKGHE